jgi:hypothetical protein
LEAGKSLNWAHFGGFEHLGIYDLARFDLVRAPLPPLFEISESEIVRFSFSGPGGETHAPLAQRPANNNVQKKNYFISTAEPTKCEEKELTDKIRSPWEWLEKAEIVGNVTRNGVLFDLWQYKTAGTPPNLCSRLCSHSLATQLTCVDVFI